MSYEIDNSRLRKGRDSTRLLERIEFSTKFVFLINFFPKPENKKTDRRYEGAFNQGQKSDFSMKSFDVLPTICIT